MTTSDIPTLTGDDLQRLRTEFEGVVETYREALKVSAAELESVRVTLQNAEHLFGHLQRDGARLKSLADQWRATAIAQFAVVLIGFVIALLKSWGGAA